MRLLAGVSILVMLTAATYQGIQPGKWETIITTESVDIPGPMAEMFKKTRGQTTRSTVCLTAEQAAKGPQGAIGASKTCRITHQTAAGGQFSAQMVCEQGGRRSVSTTEGIYTATTFDGKTRIVVDAGTGMTMRASIISRRLGACGK